MTYDVHSVAYLLQNIQSKKAPAAKPEHQNNKNVSFNDLWNDQMSFNRKNAPAANLKGNRSIKKMTCHDS